MHKDNGFLRLNMANLPTQNNNPGDLRDIGQVGATPGAGNFASFQDPKAGYAALLNDIQTKINNDPQGTLVDFASKYAPSSDGNNVAQYAANLANQLGVAPNATLSSLSPKIGQFAEAIAKNEGYQGQPQNQNNSQQYNAVSGGGNVQLNSGYQAPTPPGQQSPSLPSQGGGYAPPTPPSNMAQQSQNQDPGQSFEDSLPLGEKILRGDPVGVQQGEDTGMGIAKGVGEQLLGASGDTTNPVIEGMLSNAPQLQQGVKNLQNDLQPSNATQAAASGQTQFAANLLPIGGGVTEVADAAREAAIPEQAAQIASEKPTLGTVAKGLMSFGNDAQAAKDAQSIEPLVKSGALKTGVDAVTTAQNTATLQGEISRSATQLINDLKSGDIQQVVQPEHITEAFQNGLNTINEEADNVEQATAKYQQYWNKFLGYLPKDREVLPSDTLQARKSFDQWLGNVNKSSIFDPATENSKTIAARLVRQNANGITAANAPSIAVKDSLSYQSSLYNVLKNVAKKGAPAVKKAQEIAEMPGLKGVAMRHPYLSGAAGLIGTGLLEGAGLGAAAKYTGAFNSPQQ
jgi:hypothetical protein